MHITSTIFLPGACKDAIRFYREALGAEVMFDVSVDQLFGPLATPGTEQRTLRAGLRIGDTVVYISDGHRPGPPTFQGHALSIQPDSADDAERIIRALGSGGQILIELRKTVWAEAFGSVIDKFGVHWAVEVGTCAALAC